jgi:4-hydroxy-3-methylbut-2-enyl diphosphate reductase
MKVEKAEELGLCFGVRRAIKLLQQAVHEYGEVETLGPLAHNRLLVERLAGLGARPVKHLDEIRGRILATTTHGTSPAVLSEIETRRLQIIDTTCPVVRKAQNTARELAAAGLEVVVFGQTDHSEVKGLLGWAGEKGMAALNTKQIDGSQKSLSRLGIISQTTQTRPAFMGFVKQLLDVAGPDIKEVRLVDTLCRVTQAQQEAAIELACKSQLMIVIGGSNSANARHLLEICSSVVETHLVETANEISNSWFSGKHQVGVTAGASTPDEAVDELIARLSSL